MFISFSHIFGIPVKRIYKILIWFTKQQFFKNNLKKLKKFLNKTNILNFKIPQCLLLWSPIAIFKKYFCCCCSNDDEYSIEKNFKKLQAMEPTETREFLFDHNFYSHLDNYEEYIWVGPSTKTEDLQKIDLVRIMAAHWKKCDPEVDTYSSYKAKLVKKYPHFYDLDRYWKKHDNK